MIKPGEFRNWLSIIWQEYSSEHESYNDYPILSMQDYFKTYKYWLKREFLYQKSKKRADSDIIVGTILYDKLDSSNVTLLSSQQKYIKTLKD